MTTIAEAREAAATGFARIPWDVVGPQGELELAGGAVTVRCLQRADGSLPEHDGEAGRSSTWRVRDRSYRTRPY